MPAYYNEIDPFAAAWLRELIKAGLIADGEVDERSIEKVGPSDLAGFRQCHFFAGIGGWSLALRLAGWPDDRAVWTGSCPCQPFSSAGAQAGGHDPRDLWPVWFQLVTECRPVVVFGEQVEAAIGHGWLDRLCDDLEAEDYAVGACGLPGPSVGAFDIRQRLWFVAQSENNGHQWARETRRWRLGPSHGGAEGIVADTEPSRRHNACGRGIADELGDADDTRSQGRQLSAERVGECAPRPPSMAGDGALGHANDAGRETRHSLAIGVEARSGEPSYSGFWRDADWLPCADGKARPVEPGTFPLAHGVPNRVGRLRGYGNAIKPQVAQVFIEAYMSVRSAKLLGGKV